MSDVSIPDLIARLRYRSTSANPLALHDVAGVMAVSADALENAQTTLDMDEEYINKLEGKIYSLESVTAPTVTAGVVFRGSDTDCGAGLCPNYCSHKMWACSRCSSEGGWGSPVSDLQEMADAHRCPDLPVTAPTENTEAPLKAAMEALDRKENWSRDPDSSGWVYDIQSGARSIIARGFRLPVPVEPSSGVSS